jgi:hypothetical protein
MCVSAPRVCHVIPLARLNPTKNGVHLTMLYYASPGTEPACYGANIDDRQRLDVDGVAPNDVGTAANRPDPGRRVAAGAC